jgi:hypothetical protein
MPHLLKSRRPKARTQKRCSTCWGVIAAGEIYLRDTYKYDGAVYDWLQCRACEPLTTVVYRWVEPESHEGLSGEDFEEWACAHRDDPQHCAAARAFLARRFPESSGDGGGSCG